MVYISECKFWEINWNSQHCPDLEGSTTNSARYRTSRCFVPKEFGELKQIGEFGEFGELGELHVYINRWISMHDFYMHGGMEQRTVNNDWCWISNHLQAANMMRVKRTQWKTVLSIYTSHGSSELKLKVQPLTSCFGPLFQLELRILKLQRTNSLPTERPCSHIAASWVYSLAVKVSKLPRRLKSICSRKKSLRIKVDEECDAQIPNFPPSSRSWPQGKAERTQQQSFERGIRKPHLSRKTSHTRCESSQGTD